MRAGELRQRVTVERRAAGDDGYGNPVSGDFAPLFAGLPARIRPAGRNSDAVMAARLEGATLYEVTLRADSQSRQIGTDDRLVWGATEMAIRGRPVDPDGRGRVLVLLCEAGVAA